MPGPGPGPEPFCRSRPSAISFIRFQARDYELIEKRRHSRTSLDLNRRNTQFRLLHRKDATKISTKILEYRIPGTQISAFAHSESAHNAIPNER